VREFWTLPVLEKTHRTLSFVNNRYLTALFQASDLPQGLCRETKYPRSNHSPEADDKASQPWHQSFSKMKMGQTTAAVC
jgi:hypothetical protein